MESKQWSSMSLNDQCLSPSMATRGSRKMASLTNLAGAAPLGVGGGSLASLGSSVEVPCTPLKRDHLGMSATWSSHSSDLGSSISELLRRTGPGGSQSFTSVEDGQDLEACPLQVTTSVDLSPGSLTEAPWTPPSLAGSLAPPDWAAMSPLAHAPERPHAHASWDSAPRGGAWPSPAPAGLLPPIQEGAGDSSAAGKDLVDGDPWSGWESGIRAEGERRASFGRADGAGPLSAACCRPDGAPRPSPDAPPPAQGPITPAWAAARWRCMMTAWEVREVQDYAAVWYLGRPGLDKTRSQGGLAGGQRAMPGGSAPHGCDSARGEYLVVVGDQVAYRYEVLGELGSGSFGQVLLVADHARGGRRVALKLMRARRRLARQAAVESAVLARLRPHAASCGVVALLDAFRWRGHLCTTFERLDLNLYEYLQSRDMRGTSQAFARSVARQVLGSLALLRQLGIVHCDVKPENVMLVDRRAAGSAVKLIDFGSACTADQRVFTYIQSRFYRAPEVILGAPYGAPIDVWSLACVLAELLTGAPLFAGEDERQQLACILQVLGPAPRRLLLEAPRLDAFFDRATLRPRADLCTRAGRPCRPGSVALASVFRDLRLPAEALEFFHACLRWEPELRLTPAQALQHAWLAEGADEA